MTEIRRTQALFTEGAVLQSAATQGEAAALVYARATANGAFNAMVRLAGSEAAFGFATQLADRVAGGLRQPTEAVLVPARPEGAADRLQVAVAEAAAAVQNAERRLEEALESRRALEASLAEEREAAARERIGASIRLLLWQGLCVAAGLAGGLAGFWVAS